MFRIAGAVLVMFLALAVWTMAPYYLYGPPSSSKPVSHNFSALCGVISGDTVRPLDDACVAFGGYSLVWQERCLAEKDCWRKYMSHQQRCTDKPVSCYHYLATT